MTTFALREALKDAISSGRFEDTKIVLFSRRDSAGRVCKPKALYANSNVLKSVPYFNDLLFGTFVEAEIKDFSETAGDEFAEDYGYPSDSDLEEDQDPKSPGPVKIPTAGGPRKRKSSSSQHNDNVPAGKVVKIQDVAFITFRAFLFYLYTNSIDFAPFGSEENRKSRGPELAYTAWGDLPRPSPKSIYRLADKYDIPELKRLALNHIQNNLHSCDIVQEIFSVFTSRYDEIRSMQVIYLLSVWLSESEEGSGALHKKLDEKIDSYAAGELEHASETISAIWDMSRKNEASPPIPRGRRDSGLSIAPHIRASLVRSIRGESLIHRKYWARRSRGGNISPIYIPNAVPDPTLSKVDALVEHCKANDGHLENEGSEFPEDSDYENESEVDGAPVSGSAGVGCERGHNLLPVLKIGSLNTWRSLIFYLCADEIQFAPLKSQGSDYRSQWILKNARPDLPVPCSPKSTYALAKKIQIQPLVDLAFKNIKAKITKENAMTETFSRFASRQSKIMVMGWKHLDAKLKTEKMNESIQEIIQGMAGGDAKHQTDALKFGLYSVLRQKGSADRSFARLRCPDAACEAHHKPVSCSDPGSSGSCPRHNGWNWRFPEFPKIMECSECGHARTDHCTWCKGCRRMFG